MDCNDPPRRLWHRWAWIFIFLNEHKNLSSSPLLLRFHSNLKPRALHIKMSSWFGGPSKADPADAVEMESRGGQEEGEEQHIDESAAQKLLPDMTEEEIDAMKVEKAKNARRQQVRRLVHELAKAISPQTKMSRVVKASPAFCFSRLSCP